MWTKFKSTSGGRDLYLDNLFHSPTFVMSSYHNRRYKWTWKLTFSSVFLLFFFILGLSTFTHEHITLMFCQNNNIIYKKRIHTKIESASKTVSSSIEKISFFQRLHWLSGSMTWINITMIDLDKWNMDKGGVPIIKMEI